MSDTTVAVFDAVKPPSLPYPIRKPVAFNLNEALDEMWHEQLEHWCAEWERYGKPMDVNDLHLKWCRHLHGEVDELVRCADWKVHQRGRLADKRTVLTECVDVFKFLLSLMLTHGATPNEFLAAFRSKSLVVRKRVQLETLKNTAPQKPLLICDLDGVLCDRDPALLRYAKAHGWVDGITVPIDVPSVSAIKHALGQRRYEHLKDAFYTDGGFLVCEPRKEEIALLRRLREDVPVLLLTSRDIKRHPHLEEETYEWLAKHDVPHTAVAFASEKERAVTWASGASVAIDDEIEHVEKLALVCNSIKFTRPDDLRIAVGILGERNHGNA